MQLAKSFFMAIAVAAALGAAGARAQDCGSDEEEQTFLGVAGGDAEEAGVVVAAVVPGSAAEAAGLAPGDLIVAVGGERVASFEALTDLLGEKAPGDAVRLLLERDGWRKTVEVTLGARPVAAADEGEDGGEEDDGGGCGCDDDDGD